MSETFFKPLAHPNPEAPAQQQQNDNRLPPPQQQVNNGPHAGLQDSLQLGQEQQLLQQPSVPATQKEASAATAAAGGPGNVPSMKTKGTAAEALKEVSDLGLLKLKSNETNYVFLGTGSYGPIHRGHTASLQYVGEQILGLIPGSNISGYAVVPTGDKHVAGKVNKQQAHHAEEDRQQALSLEERRELCARAAQEINSNNPESSPFIVPNYSGGHGPTCCSEIEKDLTEIHKKRGENYAIKVLFVAGSDYLETNGLDSKDKSIDKYLRREMVCVLRSGTDRIREDFIRRVEQKVSEDSILAKETLEELKKNGENVDNKKLNENLRKLGITGPGFFLVAGFESDFSSTKVREAFKKGDTTAFQEMLHPAVLREIRERPEMMKKLDPSYGKPRVVKTPLSELLSDPSRVDDAKTIESAGISQLKEAVIPGLLNAIAAKLEPNQAIRIHDTRGDFMLYRTKTPDSNGYQYYLTTEKSLGKTEEQVAINEKYYFQTNPESPLNHPIIAALEKGGLKKEIGLTEFAKKMPKLDKGKWGTSVLGAEAVYFGRPNEAFGILGSAYSGMPITISKIQYPSSAHFYEAHKFKEGTEEFKEICSEKEYEKLAENAQKLSEKQSGISGFFGLGKPRGYDVNYVENNAEKAKKIMWQAMAAKFNQHESAKEALLATGNRILVDGDGENRQGIFLMAMRNQLKGDKGEISDNIPPELLGDLNTIIPANSHNILKSQDTQTLDESTWTQETVRAFIQKAATTMSPFSDKPTVIKCASGNLILGRSRTTGALYLMEEKNFKTGHNDNRVFLYDDGTIQSYSPGNFDHKIKGQLIKVQTLSKPSKPSGKLKNEKTVTVETLPALEAEVKAGFAGMVGVLHRLQEKYPGEKIGISIAGNIGLPAGALGRHLLEIVRDGSTKVEKGTKTVYSIEDVLRHNQNAGTQEESVLAQLMLAGQKKNWTKNEIEGLFRSSSGGWGMVDESQTKKVYGPNNKEIDFSAKQAVDIYDAVGKFHGIHDTPIVVGFAPQANPMPNGKPKGTWQPKTPGMTMDRTYHELRKEDFEEGVKNSVRSTLFAHIESNVDHVLLSQNGMGVYLHPELEKQFGGPPPKGDNLTREQKEKRMEYFKKRDEYYLKLVQDVLNEEVGPKQEKLGRYFKSVIIPTL